MRKFIVFILLLPFLFSVPRIDGIREIVVSKGEFFFVKLYTSYMENGEIKIYHPDCVKVYKEEYEFGKIYSGSQAPFYIYGRVDCNPGLYILNITATSTDGENKWYLPIFVFEDFGIKDYSPKILYRGSFNDVTLYMYGTGRCDSVFLKYLNYTLSLDPGKNTALISIPGVDSLNVKILCYFRGRELIRNYTLTFLTYREIPKIDIIDGDISDGRFTLEFKTPGYYCFDIYPPLFMSKKCGYFSGREDFGIKIVSDYNETRFSVKVTYYGKDEETEFYIPLYLSERPVIKVYYSGVDFSRRMTKLIVENEGKAEAKSIKLFYENKVYYIDKLKEGEYKIVYIPYRDEHTITLEYLDVFGNKYSENLSIVPDLVIFEEPKRDTRKDILIFAGLFITFIIILAWRLTS